MGKADEQHFVEKKNAGMLTSFGNTFQQCEDHKPNREGNDIKQKHIQCNKL